MHGAFRSFLQLFDFGLGGSDRCFGIQCFDRDSGCARFATSEAQDSTFLALESAGVGVIRRWFQPGHIAVRLAGGVFPKCETREVFNPDYALEN